MPLPGNLCSLVRVHQSPEVQQFFMEVLYRTLNAIPVFACLHKRPGNPDRSHRIEFVGVREDFCLQGLGFGAGAESVGAYRMGNCRDTCWIVFCLPEVCFCDSCPFLLVGDAGFLFLRTGNIVEEGGGDENSHIRMLGLTDLFAEAGDAEDVVKIVGSRFPEKGFNIGKHRL